MKFASTPQPTTSSSSQGAHPVRRESTEIIPPSPPKEKQITAKELAKLGIKTRDFAYEHVFPPIAPYIRGRRAPAQVQVGPAPLRRTRRNEAEEANDPFRAGPSQPVASGSGRRVLRKENGRNLERESTEPAEESQPPPPTRERGYVDLSEYQPASQSQPANTSAPRTPPALTPLYTNSQSTSAPDYSQSQSLPQFAFSQQSDYIDTPLVTPNGSLQWPEDIDIGSVSASQMDTESQLVTPEILSYSQLGFAPLQSQTDSPSQSQPEALPIRLHSHSSPLSTPPSSPLPIAALPNMRPGPSMEQPLSSPTSQSRIRSRSPRRQRTVESPVLSPLSDSEPSSPSRYNLRKRRAGPPEAPPAVRRTTRSQSRQPQPPVARPPIFSRQSAHAKGKSQQNSKATPRAKTIRKPRTTNGRGCDDMMITG